MGMSDVDLYVNKDGDVETPKQLWYFTQYEQLPPPLRSISNLVAVLEELQKTEALPYKMVCEKTLYNYCHRFEWDKRILNNIGSTTKDVHMVNSDYLFSQLWEDTLVYHRETRKLLRLIDWASVEVEDTAKIKNLSELQTRYDMSLRTLTSQPMTLANMYAMLQMLIEINEETEDKLEDTINNLLYTE